MPSVDRAEFVYLDNNATTPCAPEVVDEMLPYFTRNCGNPASPHIAGAVASEAVARARRDVAAALGAGSQCIIFTGGATEANNLAILGAARCNSKRRKIVVSTVEHKSVLLPASQLAAGGYSVVALPVDSNGVVSLDVAREVIDEETALVSVQAVNNETGVTQPIADIVALSHARRALFHCDAAQALGKMPIDLEKMGVDLASFSAHKAYGPKGVGALFLAPAVRRTQLLPLMWGGGQEGNMRPGTLNVPGIVGFASACRLVAEWLERDIERISALRRWSEGELLKGIPGGRVNGRQANRVPGTISFTVAGVPADMLVANLANVCVGEGSACNSGAPEPSHVLLAMGFERSDAESTIRISLGRYNSDVDVRCAVDTIVRVARDLVARLAS